MNKIRFSVNLLAFAVFTLALSAVAQAQATRTWVSGVGDDVNPCSRTAPCKTYAGAISKTARDGEISTLDPGGFGAVTITKSITINGGGTGQGYGSILASGTNGIVINITDPADTRKTVRLNWLDINGAPSSSPGLTGVRILAAAVVHVENTFIDSFRSSSAGFGHGIHVNATAFTEVYVRNTTIRNNLNAGIRIENTTNQVLLGVFNSKISKNGIGVDLASRTGATIANTEFTSNGTGIKADETENVIGTVVNVEGCVISFSSVGIAVGANQADARLSNNFITQNTTGIQITGTGRVFSSGNNRVIGNGTNGAPNQPVVVPI